jgi:general secretion pathway protein D
VTNNAENNFWESLEDNLNLLASPEGVKGVVISNRETGIISIRTTSAAHEDIQRFVDQVTRSARQQVLIEVTVVEVTLNDDFQAGVDWARIANGDGWSIGQDLLSSTTALGTLGTPGETGVFEASYLNTNSERTITGAIKALDTFGEVSVMSSPKIVAMNNQTSILKVADNIVYFEIEATSNTTGGTTAVITQTFNTTALTVPEGFVMNVTPFITADNEVILNIRPTITKVLRFIQDPNPALAGIESGVPEVQVREMESVLRVSSGNTAVIGGLMTDSASTEDSGIPGLHDAKGIGLAFGTKTRSYKKTELVIFLRPRVLENASLDSGLQDFKKYLNPNIFVGQ